MSDTNTLKAGGMETVGCRTLVIGFENQILRAIKKRFDVAYVINDTHDADLNWHTFHSLQSAHEAPILDRAMMSCLESVWAAYLQFLDINSRHHYYVPIREAETYNRFMLTFYKAYKLITEHRIELVLHSNIPHEGFDFVIHKIACYFGIPSVLCFQSLIPDRFWLSSTIPEFGLNSKLPELFALEPSCYSLPDNWFYMKGSNRDAAYGLYDMARELSRRPFRLPLALIRYVYARQFRGNVKRLTAERGQGAPFIYFPLHVQPELTTSAIGGIYSDQLLALETLSALLPAGHFIYVKENPKQTEKQRGPFFYKRLAALKNVRLLSRSENSMELIRSSAGVATVTGTAGWEALFQGKPVLVFGSAWYREFPGVTMYTENFSVEQFLATRPPASQVLVDFLDKALQKAGKGVTDAAYQQLVPGFDDEVNAQSVVDSFVRYVNSRMTKPASLPG